MQNSALVAFSGGLDTSYCAAYLKAQGYKVYALTVDTGGFDHAERERIGARAQTLGVVQHIWLDRQREVFERFASYIIKGNILRGNVYPLCVGSERIVQARALVEVAEQLGVDTVCHGCTGAGNDQVRFDVEIRCLNPSLTILAPIRELELSRAQEIEFLAKYGLGFPAQRARYSINQGILGTTIGGAETHDSWETLPEEAWILTKQGGAELGARQVIIEFEAGLPKRLNGQAKDGFEILHELNALGGSYQIGRGIHIGDTVLGIKGRIAFEAPGAALLIAAHRELEKLVLTKWQSYVKDQSVQLYAMLLHEGQWSNPVMQDIEALIDSSQKMVSGEVKLTLNRGFFSVDGCRSPFSLMHQRAMYGEGSSLWDGKEAQGFCKIFGMQSMLAASRGVLQ